MRQRCLDAVAPRELRVAGDGGHRDPAPVAADQADLDPEIQIGWLVAPYVAVTRLASRFSPARYLSTSISRCASSVARSFADVGR